MRVDTNYKQKGYWRVWLDSPDDAKKFINIRKKKSDDFYIVEECLINAIVLNRLDLIKLPQPAKYVGSPPEALFDYQKADTVRMAKTVRILNANMMGYGKTVEAVSALRMVNIRNAIIVAPKPVLEQWRAQFDKWWPHHPEVVINPSKPINGINLFNYEQTISESKQTMLKGRIWDAVVVDESQRIKTPNTKRTLAVSGIPAKYKFALTGTPIMKSPEDLFSQLRFLNPMYSGKSYYNFRNYFCYVKEGFFGEEVKGLTNDEFKIGVLNKLLSIVSIRNPEMHLTKGKQVIIEKVGMDPKQRKLYRDIVQLILDELPEEATVPNGAVKVLRAIQATSSPSIFLPNVWGTKFEWIRMLLEDNPDEKIVVFTRFAKTARELEKYLAKHRIKSVTYIGDIETADRVDNIYKFKHNRTVRVMIGTIACLGEGVDGLQHASHIAVFIDRLTTPETMKQCEDRLNRPGQKEKVLCYYLECRGTYDRHVGHVNETRARDIRRALNDESDDT